MDRSLLTTTTEIQVGKYLQLMSRYERLMEITRQLNSVLDLNTLLLHIIDASIELTATEQSSILLIDPTNGELRFEASSSLSSGAMEQIVVPMEGSLAGWVATHAEPVLVESAQTDTRFFNKVDRVIDFETRSLLGVPMIAHGKVIGVVEVINKINDEGWSEDDVNTLSALAAQAAIAIENARLFQQSDFVAEMVHELRNPLAALKVSTSLLTRTNLKDEQRKDIVATMGSEIERLISLTTDFLDLARLESGRTRLELSTFEMVKLIRESVQIVHPQAEAKHVEVLISEDEVHCHADRGKIKQILLNLLTNAIKYNKPEGGQVFCSVSLMEKNPDYCLVAVRDTGLGISEENQKKMFSKFFRVSDVAATIQGTGLGLAIAKRIAEAHGGQIWLESALGEGTAFFFTVPIKPPIKEGHHLAHH
jgi:signal transduction histidine kinase